MEEGQANDNLYLMIKNDKILIKQPKVLPKYTLRL